MALWARRRPLACGATRRERAPPPRRPRLPPRPQLTHQYRDASVRWVVTVAPLLPVSRAAAAAAGGAVRDFFVLGEASGAFFSSAGGAGGGAAPPVRAAVVPSTQLAVLPYSSGTTGLAKGVKLTHANLVANCAQVTAHPDWNVGVAEGSVTLGLLPCFHIYGMQMGMSVSMRLGSTAVMMSKFEPVAFLEALSKYRVTYASLVPPILTFLARHPIVANYDLSALKIVFSGAAPLDGATQAALEARLPGLRVSQGYGMTESSPVTNFVDPRHRMTGSVGPLAPSTSARIVDVDSGAVLPPGPANVGELWVKGPQVMAGYLNNAAADAATLRDGWLMTGDIAWADAAGAFYIVDRRKELIKTKGFQVAPAELEGLLINHPGVAAAAVIGAPDERAGELPIAFVTRRPPPPAAPGAPPPPPPVDEHGLREFLRPRVAEYKLPARVFFVDAIPTSATGKILRRVLKGKLAELMAGGAEAPPAAGKAA